MLIMQETWTKEGPHQAMCLYLLVVPCHGNLVCRIVDHCLPEAEYIVVAKACKEAIWLTRLVRDLGMTVEMPTLHCDS